MPADALLEPHKRRSGSYCRIASTRFAHSLWTDLSCHNSFSMQHMATKWGADGSNQTMSPLQHESTAWEASGCVHCSCPAVATGQVAGGAQGVCMETWASCCPQQLSSRAQLRPALAACCNDPLPTSGPPTRVLPEFRWQQGKQLVYESLGRLVPRAVWAL